MKVLLTLGVLFFCGSEVYAVAKDKLVIISPHRKSLQREFIPLFKEDYKSRYGKEIEVDWLDQGGTNDNVRFVRAKFAKAPKGIGIDVFWGGGDMIFSILAKEKILAPYRLSAKLDKEIPREVAGVSLRDKDGFWYGTSVSTFGIFFNKKFLQLEGMSEPKKWGDVARPEYNGLLSVVDPRRSGSMGAMVEIIMQSAGWDEGWHLLTGMAANTRKFTHSSSDPVKAVVAGDVAAALAIDFYAYSRISSIGGDKLGFVSPKGQTIINPDPVAILRGAPHIKEAGRFVEFMLRADVQKRLILAKGEPHGPKYSYLGRIAVNPNSYKGHDKSKSLVLNPFKLQKGDFIVLDQVKSVKAVMVRKDLIGAIHVDTHRELRKAWHSAIRRKDQKTLKEISRPPLDEKEFFQLADKWDDAVFRNKKINLWLESARQKYKRLLILAQAERK